MHSQVRATIPSEKSLADAARAIHTTVCLHCESNGKAVSSNKSLEIKCSSDRYSPPPSFVPYTWVKFVANLCWLLSEDFSHKCYTWKREKKTKNIYNRRRIDFSLRVSSHLLYFGIWYAIPESWTYAISHIQWNFFVCTAQFAVRKIFGLSLFARCAYARFCQFTYESFDRTNVII